VEFETWPLCERYLLHALVCADLVEQEQINNEDAARLLDATGSYLDDHARYSEGEPLYRKALSIREQCLGASHPSTAITLNNLAGLYCLQGKYIEAEPLLRRALAIREQRLGVDHPSTTASLGNLAVLYYNQGKYTEAEPLLRQALEI